MSRPLPARSQILACLGEATRPLHAREIAENLGVKEAQYSRLLDLLDLLAVEGAAARIHAQHPGPTLTLAVRMSFQRETLA